MSRLLTKIGRPNDNVINGNWHSFLVWSPPKFHQATSVRKKKVLCIYNFEGHIGISKRTPFLHRFLARCTSRASDNLVQGTKHLISFPVEYQILIICKAANIKSRHFGSLNTVRNQYAISTAFPFSSILESYMCSASAIDTTEIIC